MKGSMVVMRQMPEQDGYGSKLPQYFAAAAVTVGGFAMGNVVGWSSPALPDLVRSGQFPDMTTSDRAWIGSLVTVGAFVAALLAGVAVEKFGRKSTMLVLSLFFVAGWISISFANHIYMLYAGRFLTGIGVGAISLVAPVFLTEISEPEVRGMIGVAFQLMVILGMLFSTVVGYLTSWSWLSMASGVVPFIFLISVLCIPESPRFLLRQGKLSEANKALSWYRSTDALNPCQKVVDELENIQESVNASKDTAFTLQALVSPSTFRPILITLGLILFNQFCGVSAVNFYTVEIFENTGTGLNSYISTIIVGVVQVLSVLLASAIVDKAGRRILLLISFIFMTISLISLGFFFHIKKAEGFNLDDLPFLRWLPLGSVIVFNIGYCVGIGSLVWTVMSEILPSNVIGPVYALETAYNWLLAFLITRFFAVLNQALEIQNTFWLFAGFCVLATLFVFFTVPETKGKTLEEIQEEYFLPKNSKRPKSDSRCDLVAPV